MALRSTFKEKQTEESKWFTPAENLTGIQIKEQEMVESIMVEPECSGETVLESASNFDEGEITVLMPQESPVSMPSEPNREYPVGHGIYLFDFILGLIKKNNIPIIIYLNMNVLIIGGFCTVLLSLPIGWGLLSGLILYIGSVGIALSPIGEWILRSQNACWEIDEIEIVNRLKPLFDEVYEKARKECPNISEDIRLYMMENDSQNAFATGRNTICITRGLLDMSDGQIKGILAHEFGHLANMDTDIILVVSVGNLIITGICMAFQLCILLFHLIMGFVISNRDDTGLIEHLFNAAIYFLSMILIAAVMKVWTWIGTTLCMKTSRATEFEADKFAWRIGCGEQLYKALDEIADDYPAGFFKNLGQSHPRGSERLRQLEKLAAV